MPEPQVRIFVDEADEPIAAYRPPAEIGLDTTALSDGEHTLRIEAEDRTGKVGVRHIRFVVRNGPGITISGIRDGKVVHGPVKFRVNAFGAEEPFEPQRAESRAPIPVWVWVLALVVLAWCGWYFATLWQVPPDYATTPTYSTNLSPFGSGD